MNRARPVDAVLAALATFTVVLPMTTLFQPVTYTTPTLLVLAIVAGVGIGVRRLTVLRWPVPIVQLLAVFLFASWLHGRGHLWHGLPTPEMVDVFRRVLIEAGGTIQSYSAPAPSTRGILLFITLVVGAVAVVVDTLAVTLRSPALAGLALLTAYLVSAANSGTGLDAGFFLLAAGAWILLVGRQGTSAFRRWGTPIPLDGAENRVSEETLSLQLSSTGRRLAIGSLALAVVLPIVLPHFPERFLLAGLGRSDATGSGRGTTRLSSSVDISRNLAAQSQGVVLEYRSNGAATDPLRVDVLHSYNDGTWEASRGDAGGGTLSNPPAGSTSDVNKSKITIAVSKNRIDPPQLAAPYPAVEADLGKVKWQATSTGNIRPERRPGSYEVQYLRMLPTEDQLQRTQPEGDALGAVVTPDDTLPDPASIDEIGALNARVIPEDASEIDAARAIQNYLRNGTFAYSLEVESPGPQDHGDPLLTFLRTKTGYCIQFSSAMIMMARQHGIAARMAIGFLSGSPNSDGSYTVRGANAHAWPELLFPGIGWLRFEPTPSERTGGTAPPYSTAPVDEPTDSVTGAQSAGPSASTSSGPRTVEQQNDPALSSAPQAAPLRLWSALTSLPQWAWILIVLLLGVLGSAALPTAAALRRRREAATARTDAERAEVRWQVLLRQLDDLGIRPPPGSTPRQAGRFVSTSAHLEPEDVGAMRSVVDTLERARYAVPGTEVGDLAVQARQVRTAVSRTRTRGNRLRAVLAPGDGLDQLGGWFRSTTHLPRAAFDRLRAVWPSRGERG